MFFLEVCHLIETCFKKNLCRHFLNMYKNNRVTVNFDAEFETTTPKMIARRHFYLTPTCFIQVDTAFTFTFIHSSFFYQHLCCRQTLKYFKNGRFCRSCTYWRKIKEESLMVVETMTSCPFLEALTLKPYA